MPKKAGAECALRRRCKEKRQRAIDHSGRKKKKTSRLNGANAAGSARSRAGIYKRGGEDLRNCVKKKPENSKGGKVVKSPGMGGRNFAPPSLLALGKEGASPTKENPYKRKGEKEKQRFYRGEGKTSPFLRDPPKNADSPKRGKRGKRRKGLAIWAQ